MTEQVGEYRQAEDKVQKLGTELVNDLHMYIRSLQLYKTDNQIFLRPLNRMEKNINWLVAREGKMHLYGASSTLYINENMLRFPVSSLENVNQLIETFAKHDIAGLMIEKSINQRQLQNFLIRFAKPEDVPKRLPRVDIELETIDVVSARLKEVAAKEVDDLKAIKADVRSYAYLLYHRLYLFVKNKLLDPERTSLPPMRSPMRTIQEFIDLLSHHQLDFLGFSDELDISAYETYHICNVTVFALIFGRHLGLERLQLLELGLAALYHNIGKMKISEDLLNKPSRLSPEEQFEIKRIPLYSARAILKGAFSWDRLRHAIVAAFLQQRVRTQLQPGSTEPIKGPWLFSRILRMCSAFDALCTRRPFRPRMTAAEALLFMQKRRAKHYDPYLLDRFVRVFGSMAVKALHKQVDPFEVEDDERDSVEELVSVLGDGMEDELEEYWDLFRLPFRTDAQERRLQALANFIDAGKSGDMFDASQDGVKTVRFS